MTYRISPKRGGWIVLDLNRKQVNKGILKKKKDAIEYRDNLLNKLSQEEPSKYWFKAEYKKFVDYRMEIASDPTLELTIGGVEGYRSDYNQRIKPYFEDCLLSDFKYKHMLSFLIRCQKAGHSYKSLARTVRNIKSFLNVMKEDSKNPCLDMLKFGIHKCYEIKPDAHEEKYEAKTAVIDEDQLTKMILDLQKHKDKDFRSAYRFALISTLFLFGLRRSEVKARKFKDVDFEKAILTINSVYIAREGGLKKRTKNSGSFRNIDVDENGLKFFDWWISTVKKYKPQSQWLYPAFRGDNPLSDSGLAKLMWETLRDYGFAKIDIVGGKVTNIRSELRGACTKTFRHRLGTILIDSMDFHKLSRNYVKSALGHSRFSTTEGRYGNHNRKIHKVTTQTKGLLINSKLVS